MEKINLENILLEIKSETGCLCKTFSEITHDNTICILAEQLLTITDLLREKFDCFHLSAITAQQREDQIENIEVIYHFWKGEGISLLITLPADDPQLPSLVSKLSGADFYEREVAEMFGVTFTGRDETPPLLLPDNWDKGPPFIRNDGNDE